MPDHIAKPYSRTLQSLSVRKHCNTIRDPQTGILMQRISLRTPHLIHPVLQRIQRGTNLQFLLHSDGWTLDALIHLTQYQPCVRPSTYVEAKSKMRMWTVSELRQLWTLAQNRTRWVDIAATMEKVRTPQQCRLRYRNLVHDKTILDREAPWTVEEWRVLVRQVEVMQLSWHQIRELHTHRTQGAIRITYRLPWLAGIPEVEILRKGPGDAGDAVRASDGEVRDEVRSES